MVDSTDDDRWQREVAGYDDGGAGSSDAAAKHPEPLEAPHASFAQNYAYCRHSEQTRCSRAAFSLALSYLRLAMAKPVAGRRPWPNCAGVATSERTSAVLTLPAKGAVGAISSGGSLLSKNRQTVSPCSRARCNHARRRCLSLHSERFPVHPCGSAAVASEVILAYIRAGRFSLCSHRSLLQRGRRV